MTANNTEPVPTLSSKDMDDCPVCIAKAGEGCYIQTTPQQQHAGAGLYTYDLWNFHVGRKPLQTQLEGETHEQSS
ncbi:hypothetical protein ACFU44_13850 [Nocardia rhizosphaerihabitans]|uniref:hypothetical protein n=1 Tax=Nocardia rhizosphaerihabitans TaxID=1691570 RepID=UPI003671D90E